ncbi:MAG: hypothetical protein ACYCZC_08610 [Acidithiobacillus sp.]
MQIIHGFFQGLSVGVEILLVVFLIFGCFLWLAVPFLLLRNNMLLREIRDLLARKPPSQT